MAVVVVAALLVVAALAQAEMGQRGNLRVSFGGKLSPHKLPRIGMAPVSVALSGHITTTDDSAPPQLRRITMAINRHGRLSTTGLPRCQLRDIQPATTDEARESCPRSVVGHGHFEADVALPDQSPFPSDGKVLAFNGVRNGKPAIFAHIYGTEPLPTSFTLPFTLKRSRKGAFGTVLVANLPRVAAQWGYVSGVSLTLRRSYSYRGQRRSYVSAGCPAPKGFPGASFVFAQASFSFEGGKTVSSKLRRSCASRG